MSESDKRKSFPLRISQDLYGEIRKWSEQEMRSVNAQIEYVLREAVRKRKGGKSKAGRTNTRSDKK